MNTSAANYIIDEPAAADRSVVTSDWHRQIPQRNRDHSRQVTTLQTTLIINAVMFVVMTIAAVYANSTALLADCVDYLGDALTYGLSLAVVTCGIAAKAKVAVFKGILILLAAFIVASQVIYKLLVPSVPVFEVMGLFSLISLVANSICFILLARYKDEDINMNSVWECSLNDIAVNISIFIAAGSCWLLNSGWPDVIVASVLVVFLARSAISMIISARRELQAAE